MPQPGMSTFPTARGLPNKSGKEHKKHKTEHKRHKKDFITGSFLCLLCFVPDLLGKAHSREHRVGSDVLFGVDGFVQIRVEIF